MLEVGRKHDFYLLLKTILVGTLASNLTDYKADNSMHGMCLFLTIVVLAAMV